MEPLRAPYTSVPDFRVVGQAVGCKRIDLMEIDSEFCEYDRMRRTLTAALWSKTKRREDVDCLNVEPDKRPNPNDK